MTATVPVFMKLKLDRFIFLKILCSEFYGQFDKPFSRLYFVTDGQMDRRNCGRMICTKGVLLLHKASLKKETVCERITSRLMFQSSLTINRRIALFYPYNMYHIPHSQYFSLRIAERTKYLKYGETMEEIIDHIGFNF
jgi:hypothetical protein